MPKVDILIPSYNTARYLPFAVESVVAQTFSDWRILLVDDGSTDNTPELAAEYVQRLGARMKYIRQENAGLPAARNTAIRNSSAEFLALLDADDIWLPHRLEESLASFADRPRVGLSYGLIERIGPDGAVFDTFAGNPKYAEGMIAPYIFMRQVELPCPTMTFRRQCVDEVGLFDETMRATEDRDLWLRIALRYEVAAIPRVIAQYRTSPSSMSTDPSRMLRAQLQFIRKHYGAPGCGWVTMRRATSRVYKQQAEALERRKEFRPALLSALRALGKFPFDTGNARTVVSLLLQTLRQRGGE
jgi:glycosyltransferase involved in cell wall biosynthesis